MTPDIKPLVAGNWKMNGTSSSLSELESMSNNYNAGMKDKLDLLVCVPATLLQSAASRCSDGNVRVGGQDCHANTNGAHTGDISAEMILDAGGTSVIVGHSERRTDHGEDNSIVKSKAEAGLRAGLQTIVCIGETEAERKSGNTLAVLGNQLDGSMPDNSSAQHVVIAYEPVWAIGTGLVPTASDVEEAHAFVRTKMVERFGGEGAHMRLLYGGSVKAGNAEELMGISNVDGALVGGASLKAEDFLGICAAYEKLG